MTIINIINVYYNSYDNTLLFLSAESSMYKIDLYSEEKKLYTMLANYDTLLQMYNTGLWTYIGVL